MLTHSLQINVKVSRSSEVKQGVIMASDRWIFPDGRQKTFRRMDAEKLVKNRRKYQATKETGHG